MKDERDSEEDGGEERDAKTQWAKDRTDWAEDRTLLANERTFAGWLRTGAACVAVALGLTAVFGEAEPTWLAKGAATVFLLAAAGIFVASAQQSYKAQSRITEHDTEAQPPRRMIVLSAALVLGTAVTGGILWTL
jgi:putative membrane protein